MTLLLLLLELFQDAGPAAEGIPLEVLWRDGLRIRSTDGAFEGRVGITLLLDGRHVVDRPDDDTPPLRSAPDSIFVRRARLGVDGTLDPDWAFRVTAGVGTGRGDPGSGSPPNATTATLLDGWIEWRRWPELRIRAGQFFQPVTQEGMTSLTSHEFAERSLQSRLAPGRDLGIGAAGDLAEGRLSYFAMLSHGGALTYGDASSVQDRDDALEISGIVHVRPFAGAGWAALEGLQLSAGGSFGLVGAADGADFDLASPELSILFVDGTGGTFEGRRTRLAGGIAWTRGPVGARAEFLAREDELAAGPSPRDSVRTTGAYAQASWMVTGEEKRFGTRVYPEGSEGAVELALRAATIEVEDVLDAGIAPAGENSGRMSAWTAGIGWWPAPQLRLVLNAIHERSRDPLRFDGRTEDRFTGFLVRAQISF